MTARVACAARGDPRLGLGGDVLDSIVHARGDGFIAERRWHVSDACGVGVPVGCGKFGSGVRTIESAVGAVGFGEGGEDRDRSLGVDFVHRLLLARPRHVGLGDSRTSGELALAQTALAPRFDELASIRFDESSPAHC